MKLFSGVMIPLLFCLMARGEDWTTSDGVTYKDVTVVSHDSIVVNINSSSGPVTISLSHLDQSIQKRIANDHATAKDWVTTDGKVYKNVKVIRHDDDNVSILNDDGGASIPWDHLPLDLQLHLGHDPVKVAAAKAAAQAAAEDARKKQEEEKAKQAAEILNQIESTNAKAQDDYAKFEKSSVNGQVFIATKGGTTFKLPLVHVYLFSEEQMVATLFSQDEKAKAAQAALKPTIEKEKRAYIQSRIDYNAGDSGESSWQAALSEIKSTLNDYYHYRSQDYYALGFPDPLASAESDADGKFTIQIPKEGNWVLAAQAHRSLIDSEEHYFWVAKVNKEDLLNKEVFLNNDNFSDSDSTDSMISALDSNGVADCVSKDLQDLDDYAEQHPKPPPPPPPAPEPVYIPPQNTNPNAGPGSL